MRLGQPRHGGDQGETPGAATHSLALGTHRYKPADGSARRAGGVGTRSGRRVHRATPAAAEGLGQPDRRRRGSTPASRAQCAHSLSNPIKYTDPSGHEPCETGSSLVCTDPGSRERSRSTQAPPWWQLWWWEVSGNRLQPEAPILVPLAPYGPVIAPKPGPVPNLQGMTSTPVVPRSTLLPYVTTTTAPQEQAKTTNTVTTTPSPAPTTGRVILYRAIDEIELSVVLSTGTYGYSPNGSGKYFAYTYPGVVNFAKSNFNRNSVMTITQIDVSREMLLQGYSFNDVAGAGPSIHFSDAVLPALYVDMSAIIILGSP